MKSKNPYRKKSRIGTAKTREIIKYFSMDFPAVRTTELTGLNHKTIDNWYNYLREMIYLECEKEKQEKLGGGVYELDESYFGPKRIRGKRGRGAGGPRCPLRVKTIVFGILKRGGKVYTEVIPDAKAKSLIPIIRGKVDSGSIINTDGWRAYSGLVEMGYEKHYRVHHGKNEFARGKQHINGIESFWSFTKRRFIKFNGIKKEFFHLYLKESEFRYNVRIEGGDLYKILLKKLRNFNP